jgi:hypothetical protein
VQIYCAFRFYANERRGFELKRATNAPQQHSLSSRLQMIMTSEWKEKEAKVVVGGYIRIQKRTALQKRLSVKLSICAKHGEAQRRSLQSHSLLKPFQRFPFRHDDSKLAS